VFCEGFGLKKNPYFQLFTALWQQRGIYYNKSTRRLKLQVAVKSSVFILPLGNDLYKVGATYNNQDTSEEPTDEAREKSFKETFRNDHL
jgi:glycine oxidase